MKSTASAVIFDLDGTLVDSLEDLADAVNAALAAFSLPTHPLEPYKYFVGDGMETLLRRAAPPETPEEILADLVARMKQEYARNWAVKTRPYQGIAAMLTTLAGKKIPMAVLTNKPHEFAGEVVNRFFPDAPFAIVQGSPSGGKAKPDPAMALSIAERFGLKPECVAFIGDSRTDMDTAVNAGMLPVGVLWGFRPERELLGHGAKVIISTPGELSEKVAFQAAASAG